VGPGHDEHHEEVKDMSAREMGILVPIALVVIILGVLPTGVMRSMSNPIEVIRAPVAKIELQQNAVANAFDRAMGLWPAREPRTDQKSVSH
jgi:NADH:ubiquinone oxidoreductase subunit 4 (subunit M)